MQELPDNPELFESSVKAALEISQREAQNIPQETPEAPKVEATAKPSQEEAPKPVAQPEAQSESLASKFKKLLDREAAARDAEAKAKAERENWEKSRAEQDKELAEYRAWKAKRVDEARQLELDPYGFIKSRNPNIDPTRLANRIWGRTLGDAAPPEIRQEEGKYEALKGVDELRAEFADWRAQQEEKAAQAAQEQAYYQYVGSVQAYATSNLDKHPLIKAYAEASPEKVTQALLKVANNHATATAGKEILTPEQSAEQLETLLNNIAKRLAPPAPKSEQPVTNPSPTTLRNQHQSVQQPREVADRGEALFQFALEQARKVGSAG